MLTYLDDDKPVKVSAPDIRLVTVPRKGIIGWIKDRIFGPIKKPQTFMVLTKEQRQRLKEIMDDVSQCGATASELTAAADKIVVLGRGHHIRNEDGTITDVTNNPKYKVQKPEP